MLDQSLQNFLSICMADDFSLNPGLLKIEMQNISRFTRIEEYKFVILSLVYTAASGYRNQRPVSYGNHGKIQM